MRTYLCAPALPSLDLRRLYDAYCALIFVAGRAITIHSFWNLLYFSKLAEMEFQVSSAKGRRSVGDEAQFSLAIPSAAAMVATKLAPGLSQRTWTIGLAGTTGHCYLFLLRRGRASYIADLAPDVAMEAPALLWLPPRSAGDFIFAAGSEGAMLDVKEDFVRRAVGNVSIAQHLRIILDWQIIAPSELITPLLDEFKTIIDALVRETSDPKPGGESLIEIYLEATFVHLWRVSGGISEMSQRGAPTTLAQRYLQFVEIHFRNHLSVDEFAKLLGVPRSSLHEACLKARGRTPLRLLHDRLLEEASNRLASTDLAIEQIAYGLGFRDAAYFNRFFKRLAGVTPGEFRKTTERKQVSTPQSFAAWP